MGMKVKCLYDKLVSVKDLRVHPKNRNKHPDAQIQRLAEILEYQGFRYPIKVSKLSGYITSGHGRLSAAIKNGWIEVPVNYQEYESEAQEYADVQADNAIASWAELDLVGINTDVSELGDEFDVNLLGIEDFEYTEPKEEPGADEDEVPEPTESIAKLGDIWKLGNHRLMCGDSTSIDAVEKLMDGEKADMVFTDPPYGIGFKYNSHKDTTGDEYKDFCRDWFHNLKIQCDFIVISTGWAYNLFWYQNEPKDTFYWLCKNKRTGGSISHFRKVEPLFIWGKPANRYDFDFFEQTTQIEQDLKGQHTCPKPVSLIESIIHGCKDKGSILDVFGGSGTTLIACEKTNRKCFMMELDPHYVDVIIARWEKYANKKAELLNGTTA
jgi:DNA modification methylase